MITLFVCLNLFLGLAPMEYVRNTTVPVTNEMTHTRAPTPSILRRGSKLRRRRYSDYMGDLGDLNDCAINTADVSRMR